MIIKTRKMPATNTEGARMRATASPSRAQLTIPYPYESTDPHATVAEALAIARGYTTVTNIGGNRWEAK